MKFPLPEHLESPNIYDFVDQLELVERVLMHLVHQAGKQRSALTDIKRYGESGYCTHIANELTAGARVAGKLSSCLHELPKLLKSMEEHDELLTNYTKP